MTEDQAGALLDQSYKAILNQLQSEATQAGMYHDVTGPDSAHAHFDAKHE